MSRRISRFLVPAACLAAATLLAACGGARYDNDSAGQADAEGEQGATVASAPLITDALKAKLVSADALDGTTDHVVERCAGCRLGMNGKAEHPLQVEGYTLHMCSESCKAAFNKDLQASLAKLEVPQS